MPRPNPPRALQSEENLARRIAYERENRGWTYEGIAKRLTEVGCPIQGSAIYKIEKGIPRRRISVDELVGFASVFELDIDELLTPMTAVLDRRAAELLDAYSAAHCELLDSIQRALAAAKSYASLHNNAPADASPFAPPRWLILEGDDSTGRVTAAYQGLMDTITEVARGEHPEAP